MDISLSIFNGVSKKSGLPYKALEIKVGKWRKLVFLSEFELEYVSDILAKNK